MGRKVKKTTSHFLHENDHSGNKELYLLQKRFGNDGYAFYFKMLELISKTEGFVIDITSEYSIVSIADYMNLSKERFVEILLYAAEIGLIEQFMFKNKKKICSVIFIKQLKQIFRRNKLEIDKIIENIAKLEEKAMKEYKDTNHEKKCENDTLKCDLDSKINELSNEVKELKKIVSDIVTKINDIENVTKNTISVTETDNKKTVKTKKTSKKTDNDDFIDKVILLFCQKYEQKFHEPYIVANRGKERQGAGKLVQIMKQYKPEYKSLNSEQMLEKIGAYIDKILAIEDEFLMKNLSLMFLVSNINKYNAALKMKSSKGKIFGRFEVSDNTYDDEQYFLEHYKNKTNQV